MSTAPIPARSVLYALGVAGLVAVCLLQLVRGSDQLIPHPCPGEGARGDRVG